jgi:alkylated DNA nucleotide flippase Atl1
MAKKTAIQQLNDPKKQTHIVSPIPQGFIGWNEHNSMVVSTPYEVDSLIRQIPNGRLTTLEHLRKHLAGKHKADMACPVSTAIFINVTARATEEYRALGETELTPYWRVLRTKGLLNPKYPGGEEAQKEKLEAEGFTVTRTKSGYKVEEYESFVFNELN